MRLLKVLAIVGLFLATLPVAARAGSLKIKNTTFGWNPLTQSIPTSGTTPQSQFPAIAVNQPIEIIFDSDLQKSSVTASTVNVTSIGAEILGPLGLTSAVPGGQIAPVSLSVSKKKLTIRPATLFAGSSVSFGFAAGAYYRLQLKGKEKGVKGEGGDALQSTVYISFRTSAIVSDPSPGAPQATVKLKDHAEGGVTLHQTSVAAPQPGFDKTTPNPSPSLKIIFNEHVLPSTVLNPATGISPTLSIQLDVDDVNTTQADRVQLPGAFALSHGLEKTTVEWTSTLLSIPGDRLYILSIKPLIQDLVGNSLFTETGDIGLIHVYAFRTKDVGGVPLPPIKETFNSVLYRDDSATSADWAGSVVGVLLNGVGGGTGADGLFAPTQDTVLATSVYDSQLGQDVQKIWNFTTFDIPSGVTVTATGDFPLIMRCTGKVNVNGTLDLSGAAGEEFNEIRVEPGAGGGTVLSARAVLDDATGAGGGDGALGGSVTDGQNVNVALFLATVPGYAAPVYVNQGLSGLSSAITAFQLGKSSGINLSTGMAGLWLQPNIGTGSSITGASPGSEILHDHPTFVIQSVTLPSVLQIISDTQDPHYYGPLNQPSQDLYELPPPPIAKPGDPFMIGDLAGHEGETVGLPGGGGQGSLPLTVAQSFITQVRSGGGGGGGARFAGTGGEDSPPAGMYGESTGTAGGAGGAGYLTAAVVSKSATVLNVSGTPFAGFDLGAAANDPPCVVFPNAATGFVFEIESNTDSSVTVRQVALPSDTPADTDGNNLLNLDDVALGASCRVEPGFGVGGNGGGSSGVHLAGTTKLSGPPNLTRPTWTPGAGGGAGGGAISIESAQRISVPVTGSILARGGAGGRTTGPIGSSASGGGGGGGGSLRLAAADTTSFAVRVDGLVDADGGAGGLGYVDGGAGGAGRVRLESVAGTLESSAFPLSHVTPALLNNDIGYLIPGLAPSAGQSLFYFTESLVVHYMGYMVTYNASINGVPATGLEYTLADYLLGTPAPFTITFNDALMDAGGELDPTSVDEDFTGDVSLLSGPFIRFRLVLQASIQVGADEYTDVAIDTVQIDFES
ncbi:MAG: hypothetical protein HY812_21770 [Planctomycetes bacterium]|nr:hypothetical protein [Planctomycetota bacterium]